MPKNESETKAMLKKAEGHSVLLNTKTVSPVQMKLVEDLLSLYRAKADVDEATAARYLKGILQRKELKAGHNALRGKLASPYFIAKNVACQVKGQHGMYNLTVLKVDVKLEKAAAVKASEAAAAAEAKANGTDVPTTPKKKKAAKKTTAKKEDKPKKEAVKSNKKSKKELPAAETNPETLPTEPTPETIPTEAA